MRVFFNPPGILFCILRYRREKAADFSSEMKDGSLSERCAVQIEMPSVMRGGPMRRITRENSRKTQKKRKNKLKPK